MDTIARYTTLEQELSARKLPSYRTKFREKRSTLTGKRSQGPSESCLTNSAAHTPKKLPA